MCFAHTKSGVSAWVGPQGALIGNDEVARVVKEASEGRLVGVGSVDIRKPMEAVEEVKRCVAMGFKAIRVLPWLWELPPTHPTYYPVYVTCCQLNVPFCLQIGHTGPLMSSEVGRPIYMDRVCLDFPDLKVVGGHIGYPWTDEAIALATKHRNFYIDTSAYTCKRYPRQLVEFMQGHGRKKVLFGSNYPMIEPKKCLDGLAGLGLDKEAEAMFLAGNAVKVFNLAGSTSRL